MFVPDLARLMLAPGGGSCDISPLLQTPGSPEAPVHAQPMVPSVANFSFVKRERFSGRMCDKFTMEEDVGQKHNLYTLWTTTEVRRARPGDRGGGGQRV